MSGVLWIIEISTIWAVVKYILLFLICLKQICHSLGHICIRYHKANEQTDRSASKQKQPKRLIYLLCDFIVCIVAIPSFHNLYFTLWFKIYLCLSLWLSVWLSLFSLFLHSSVSYFILLFVSLLVAGFFLLSFLLFFLLSSIFWHWNSLRFLGVSWLEYYECVLHSFLHVL